MFTHRWGQADSTLYGSPKNACIFHRLHQSFLRVGHGEIGIKWSSFPRNTLIHHSLFPRIYADLYNLINIQHINSQPQARSRR